MQTEVAIEMLIANLDAIDADSDLEPSLGYYNTRWEASDAEAECKDEGAQCDDDGDISDSGIGNTDG